MSIVTKGLGSDGGLICQGYGWFHKIIEKIKEIISRTYWMPKKRKHVTLKIQITGDVVMHSEWKIPVQGERDFTKLLWLLLEDED